MFREIDSSSSDTSLDDVIERVGTDGIVTTSPSPFVFYSIHDGDRVPPSFARSATGEAFARERDFGADTMAAALAAELRIAARFRVRLARSVIDAGRAFGLDDGRAGHTSRLAIPSTIASDAPRESLAWLERAHARIEETIAHAAAATGPSPIAIGVHTYDPVSADGSARPEISLLDLPESVARGTFDFWPRATADSAKLDRVVGALVAGGISVRRNDPYLLPDGSIEVRILRRARRESWPNRDRIQAFVLEVRKDLICEGRQEDGYFAATAIRGEAVRALGHRVARAFAVLANS